MKIQLDLDEQEVASIRLGKFSASLSDKLLDAVEVRQVGWYEVAASTSHAKRAYWWDGKVWRRGPDDDTWLPTLAEVEPIRLHRYDEC